MRRIHVDPAASRGVLPFIVAPRLETLYARVCMCPDAFDTPCQPCVPVHTKRADKSHIYIYTSHVNRIAGFIELHWQRSNDKEKLSRTDGGEDGRRGNDLCEDAENKGERERKGEIESRGEETRGRRKETRSTLDSKMHIAPR